MRGKLVIGVTGILLLTILLAPMAHSAWIRHELPHEVIIGKKYENVFVNLTSEEVWRGVSYGTLYWCDDGDEPIKMLQKIDKFTPNNLADGYEDFYFDFIITDDMATPNTTYHFYIEFNFTNPNETKMFYIPTTAVIGPIADFSWKEWRPTDDSTVHFKDKSKQGYVEITSWTWDFGDGNISHGQNPDHVYTTRAPITSALPLRMRVAILIATLNK